MPINLISQTTQAGALKVALDQSAARVRMVANRVALASAPDAKAFALPSADAAANADTPPEKLDLESEMANLANEQLRFEATAKLLEKTYATLRASLTER